MTKNEAAGTAGGDDYASKFAQASAVYADLQQKQEAAVGALRELKAERAALPGQIRAATLAGDAQQLAQLGARQLLLPALILQSEIGAERLWLEVMKQGRVVAQLKMVPLRAEYDALEEQKRALDKRQGELSHQMGNLKARSSGPINLGRLTELEMELKRMVDRSGAPVVRSLPHARP